MKKTLLSIACISLLFVQSCKKDEESSAQPGPTVNNTVNIKIDDGEIVPSDGNGSFAAVHTVNTIVGESDDILDENDFYTAAGGFYNSIPVTAYVDGGQVILNSKDTLTKFFGIYVLTSGENFIQAGNTWTVTGNPASGIGAFTYVAGNVFPSFSLWNVKSEYNKSAGISITLPGNYSNTDTAVFVVASYVDDTKKVAKLVSPNNRTISFTASELASIPSGEISIQLTAVKTYVTVNSNKKYYFLNEFQRTANSILN
jgi:hypothetical protein